MQFVVNALPDLTGNVHCQSDARFVFGDIEKGFVERKRFYHIGIIVKNGVHLL